MQSILERVANKRAYLFSFAGQQFIADASGILFWPRKRLLIVSDLHLEKASFLAQNGNPIPRFDSRKTLTRLSQIVACYRPESVVCLGDSFHDAGAFKRLEAREKKMLTTMMNAQPQWIWVLGNHDPFIPATLGGVQRTYLKFDDLYLCHEPLDLKPNESQIFGHFHPKMHKKIARHQMTGRCFMYYHQNMVMPAFGAYTGGLIIEDVAFTPFFDIRKASKLQIYQDKIFAYS